MGQRLMIARALMHLPDVLFPAEQILDSHIQPSGLESEQRLDSLLNKN